MIIQIFGILLLILRKWLDRTSIWPQPKPSMQFPIYYYLITVILR